MSTIKDIAHKAGVSISTVSYALNGVPKVNQETRDRILAIARELNYHPNSLARNLKRGSTQRIGVFVNELSGSYINGILRGIQDVLNERDYDLIAATMNAANRERSASLLREKWLDGAILINSAHFEAGFLNTVSASLPLVLLDRNPAADGLEPANIRTLAVDNATGVRDLTSRLADAGRRRFVFLAGLHDSYDSQARLAGFRAVLTARGIAFDESAVVEADFSNRLAYERMRGWLAGHPRPDAVVCANDEMALGAMHALQEAGFRVPADVAVTGFDDIEFAPYANPPLTTVRFDRLAMGRSAAQDLLSMLDPQRHPAAAAKAVFPAEPVIRASCGTRRD